MKKLLLALFLCGCQSIIQKIVPPPATPSNLTGVINSDYPRVNDGWLKGWLVAPTHNVVFIERHGNPYVGATVFAKDTAGVKYTRTIAKMIVEDYSILGDQPPNVYYGGGDIVICKLDKPFPASIVGYKMADYYENGQEAYLLREHAMGSFYYSQLIAPPNMAYLNANLQPPMMIGGSSGFPWFVFEHGEWEVISHFHRGGNGEGPNYAHPFIHQRLLDNIAKIQRP